MKTKNNRLTLDRFKDKNYGKPGTEKRDKLEEGFENFKRITQIYKDNF